MNSTLTGLRRWFLTGPGQLVLVALVLVSVYLIAEHTAHVVGLLPFALILLCPLLHLFMHTGHDDHGGHTSASQDGPSATHQQQHAHDKT